MTNPVQQTRATYNMLIGQVIEKTLGLGGVCALFDAAEAGDADAISRIEAAKATGKAPSGFLALDLGIVDVETKEALLTAQAAERTLLVMDQLQEFYEVHVPAMQKIIAKNEVSTEQKFENNFFSPHKDVIEKYMIENVKPADVDNQMFKFIGSKGEAMTLVLAQATQQLATEYLRNEQIGMKHKLMDNPFKIGQMYPLGMGYSDGFIALAVQSYAVAAQTLTEKKYETAADDIDAVIDAIDYDQDNAARHSPKDFAETAVHLQKRLAQKENNMYLDAASVRQMQLKPLWEEKMTQRARQSLGLTA